MPVEESWLLLSKISSYFTFTYFHDYKNSNKGIIIIIIFLLSIAAGTPTLDFWKTCSAVRHCHSNLPLGPILIFKDLLFEQP